MNILFIFIDKEIFIIKERFSFFSVGHSMYGNVVGISRLIHTATT